MGRLRGEDSDVTDVSRSAPESLSRGQISSAVDDLGWRFVLGAVRTSVAVRSMGQAVDVAARVVRTCHEAGTNLAVDIRQDRVLLRLQPPVNGSLTPTEIDVARRITDAVEEIGLTTDADAGDRLSRSVQALEIAIDAIDIPTVRPFWKAVLAYSDEAEPAGAADPIVDPAGEGPAIWFQQMTVSRPQRNRLHLDISVPHDQAPHRICAALAAGGRLVSDAHAPSFWVLADAEGNEACVSTWQGRDD
jgi:4a-hydroxytetrahydrobiopterin dehydratase